MKECILLVLLGLYSWWDIREQKLPLVWVLTGVAVSLMFVGKDVLLCMLPGILLIVVSTMTKNKIGAGDGFMIVIIGNMSGVYKGAAIIMATFAVSFAYSCFLLLIRRENTKYRFPFAPCCFLGAVIVVIRDLVC